ncbi:hypothetical protein C8046_03030 [Serinibacter arcticus]|uniref:Uncharacterized protein n=1 Tax=Serinibacter arcticus TaxID=1655435 RepID=A0A2U1ZS53_9MICO|nr:hypothetical protein [Serinibacter arcticus]PWD49818.1 hypothetical protein C8046_03030 [Serinibacter arcticus]
MLEAVWIAQAGQQSATGAECVEDGETRTCLYVSPLETVDLPSPTIENELAGVGDSGEDMDLPASSRD